MTPRRSMRAIFWSVERRLLQWAFVQCSAGVTIIASIFACVVGLKHLFIFRLAFHRVWAFLFFSLSVQIMMHLTLVLRCNGEWTARVSAEWKNLLSHHSKAGFCWFEANMPGGMNAHYISEESKAMLFRIPTYPCFCIVHVQFFFINGYPPIDTSNCPLFNFATTSHTKR